MHKFQNYKLQSFDQVEELHDDELQASAQKAIKHKLKRQNKGREVKPVGNRPRSAVANIKVEKL